MTLKLSPQQRSRPDSPFEQIHNAEPTYLEVSQNKEEEPCSCFVINDIFSVLFVVYAVGLQIIFFYFLATSTKPYVLYVLAVPQFFLLRKCYKIFRVAYLRRMRPRMDVEWGLEEERKEATGGYCDKIGSTFGVEQKESMDDAKMGINA